MITEESKLELSLYAQIPDDVLQAARLIEEWMVRNGWKHWRLNGIADRNLVEKLEDDLKKRDKLTEGILNYAESETDGE